MLVPWTPLRCSRRERGVLRIGQALAGAAAVGLIAVALGGDEVDAAALVGGILAAVAGLAAALFKPAPALEIAVDGAGRLAARRTDPSGQTADHRLQCVYATPWLITLRSGTMWVRIWPDSLPGSTFRRFWVHVRWSPGRQPEDRAAATAPARPG